MAPVGDDPGYELLDFGGGERLERFGDRVVVRPHPSATGTRSTPGRWVDADLQFDRERGWQPAASGPWTAQVAGLTLELRATEAGQVGLFPEQAAVLPWLRDRIGNLAGPDVLHLFAYTGLATLAMADAGAAVTHVDASRPAVAWARRNADLSGRADRPIRWIVDDAVAFTQREVRRGRRYGGLVLDPPTYGHGPRGRDWRVTRDLEPLLAAARALLKPGAFVLLTSHTLELEPGRLRTVLANAMETGVAAVERGSLALRTREGRALSMGAFARWPAGA
jgi:23S rRNA (cytosine1962-C5)-methyltransferase